MLVVFTAMIGFAEEALCRGVMVHAFQARGPLQAAAFSSLIFGSMHLIQVFYGMPIGTALLYAVYAALIGFGFAAPYLHSGGAIWPLSLHTACTICWANWGTAGEAQAQPTTSVEIVVRLGLAIYIGIYGLWLLKQKSPVPVPAV